MRAYKLLLALSLTAGRIVSAIDPHPGRPDHQKGVSEKHHTGTSDSENPAVNSHAHSPRDVASTEHQQRESSVPPPECHPLAPWCPSGKRDADDFTPDNAVAADDWTRWACSRGVQWACNYPESPHPEKRDDAAADEWYCAFFPEACIPHYIPPAPNVPRSEERDDDDDDSSSCESAEKWCGRWSLDCACNYFQQCYDGEYRGDNDHGIDLTACVGDFLDRIGDKKAKRDLSAIESSTESLDDDDDDDSTCTRADKLCNEYGQDCACGYYRDCFDGVYLGYNDDGIDWTECGGEVMSDVWHGIKDIWDKKAKRDSPAMDSSAPNPSTTKITDYAGNVVTAVISVVQTSPPVIQEIDDMGNGSKLTVIVSASDNKPSILVATMAFAGSTTVTSWTMSTPVTNVAQITNRLSAYSAMATKTSPYKRHEMDEDVQTVSILDQRPGHKILNPAAASQTTAPTTRVTIADVDGAYVTLVPATNAEGYSLLTVKGKESSFRRNDIKEGQKPQASSTSDDTRTTIPHRSTLVGEPVSLPPMLVPGQKDAAASANPAVTKYITETVTRYGRYPDFINHHSLGSDWMRNTATVARIADQTYHITKPLQMINAHTMIRAMPPAQASLVPLVWDNAYLEGWEHVLELNMLRAREMYPHADWEELPRVEYALRQHRRDLEPELSWKFALIMLLRGRHHGHYGGYPPITPLDRFAATETVVSFLNGTTFHMTAPTQTVNGHVMVADPHLEYRLFDPYTHNVAPTGACHEHKDRWWRDHGGNKKHWFRECQVEQCMWEFMRPINITTAAPMGMYDRHGDIVYDYFTHRTELHYPHWGTKGSQGLYYPMKHTHSTNSNGYPTHTVVRETPGWQRHDVQHDMQVHGDPKCHDIESCHRVCKRQTHDPWLDPKKMAMIIGPILGVMLLALLCCCGCLFLRRHRRNRDPERRRSSLPEKFRRRSTQPQEVVVNQATGEATDRATGQPVDPSTAATTAVIAGTAAGAAAASGDHGNGDQSGKETADGKGTTGRRAEEGRGRVNFEDGGKPGTDAPGPSSSAKPEGESSAPKEAPSAEPSSSAAPEKSESVPAHSTDGAGGPYTAGRQMPDMGSMRGRKRNRPEGGIGGLNLGF